MLFLCLFEIQIGLVLIMCFIGAKNACYRGQMHVFWVFVMSIFFMIMCPQCTVDEYGFLVLVLELVLIHCWFLLVRMSLLLNNLGLLCIDNTL